MSSSTIVLITGGNTGLGLETVKSLCRSSKAYTILLGGRSIEKANAAAIKAREEYSDTASTIQPIQIDIEDDASIDRAFEEVSSKFGRVDVLLNNAGKFSTAIGSVVRCADRPQASNSTNNSQKAQ